MKLRNVMKEYLDEPVRSPSLGLLRESFITPCNVKPKSSWNEQDLTFNKEFNFKKRNPMRKFCSFLLDLEDQTGMKICFSIRTDSDSVGLEIPKRFLNLRDFRSLSNKIDNIFLDVNESYRDE